MATTKVVEQPRPSVFMMQYRELGTLLATGAVIGLVTYAFYILLDRYVFTPLLCEGATMIMSRCADKANYASSIAMVLGGLGALFAMVQQRVYRPLLVVLLVTIALWGILQIGAGLQWWMLAGLMAAVFALAYAAFAWLVQVRNIYIALGLSVVLLVFMRLVLG